MILQKGMWAMIAVSIAMAIWTAGVLYMSVREEKRTLREEEVPVEKLQIDADEKV